MTKIQWPSFFLKKKSQIVFNDMYIVSSLKLSKISHRRLQIPLTTLLQLVIMVKLWLIITIYILRTYDCIESKLQLIFNNYEIF
jgi:hypothetical protein